jgi:tRNA-dihydrouridine synthase A
LAHCATLAQQWSYDEINLNCGCPSERVQHGAFGACLMAEPALVADCIKAMQDASGLSVTVKHRLGLDYSEDYDFVRRFVEVLAKSGCGTYVVHARNAVLEGLSPKDNREVPSLRYEEVYRLKHEFPELKIVINGGIRNWGEIEAHLQHVDGVMLGRAAYHDPYILSEADSRLFGSKTNPKSRADVVTAMHAYAQYEIAHGVSLRSIARHMLGLFHGQPRARLWRGMLSDSTRLAANDPDLLMQALEAVTSTANPAIAA